MVEGQRAAVMADVRRLKGHPAVLCWGLGNEMDGPTGQGDSEALWREIGNLARLGKEIDPDRPVMTVVANVNPDKLRAIRDHAPAVDILGVNAYAGAAGIGDEVRRLGWKRPYCVTEYGPPGPWGVEQTPWNAPLEPSSRRKAPCTTSRRGTSSQAVASAWAQMRFSGEASRRRRRRGSACCSPRARRRSRWTP
jgi:hypothetical protein